MDGDAGVGEPEHEPALQGARVRPEPRERASPRFDARESSPPALVPRAPAAAAEGDAQSRVR